MLYLLSYDVSEDKKRNKICKTLKNEGYHLQKSVFVFYRDAQDALKIYKSARELIDEKTDRLFMAPMCQTCFGKKQISGICPKFNESLWII